MVFYAVAVGRQVGIYTTWGECQKQISGFPGARFRKFELVEEAEMFVSKVNGDIIAHGVQSFCAAGATENAAAPSTSSIDQGPFYAVAQGRQPGIYKTWDQCQAQTEKFSGAKYKKFSTYAEAQQYLQENRSPLKTQQQQQPRLRPAAESAAAKPMSNARAYYVVARGREPGIYTLWPQCQEQVDDFPNPVYRKFLNLDEAREFLEQHSKPSNQAQREKMIPVNSAEKTQFKNPNLIRYKKVPLTSSRYSGHQFDADCEGYVHVFTDGACDKNGKRNAKAGIGVWFSNKHPLNVSEPVRGRPTNNVAEIEAAIKAVQIAKSAGISKLQINTDSQFLINSVTVFASRWQSNNWLLQDGTKVKNKIEFEVLLEELKSIDVKWVFAKGHANIQGNEAADGLARDAVARYKN